MFTGPSFGTWYRKSTLSECARWFIEHGVLLYGTRYLLPCRHRYQVGYPAHKQGINQSVTTQNALPFRQQAEKFVPRESHSLACHDNLNASNYICIHYVCAYIRTIAGPRARICQTHFSSTPQSYNRYPCFLAITRM